jgi:hypothetical protein
MQSILELLDLLEVYIYLKNQVSQGLLSRIKKSLAGCILLSEEKKTYARDIFFELKIASKFKKSGFTINLEALADLSVSIEEYKYNIECKRVQSYASIDRNIEKAFEQLKKENQESEFGIISMDFSKIYYNEIKKNGENAIISSVEEIDNARKTINEFFPQCIEDAHSAILDDIAFFIGHVRFPVIIPPYQITAINHFFTLISSNVDRTYTKSAMTALSKGVG